MQNKDHIVCVRMPKTYVQKINSKVKKAGLTRSALIKMLLMQWLEKKN